MNVKYIAEIKNTKEIILTGTANLAFWRERLRRENLFPFDSNGKAEIFIGTIESKFNGIKFRELTFSIAASRQTNGATNDGFFLVSAFSSLRLFAFFERFLFKTPYNYASIELNFPVSVKLQNNNETLFAAKRDAKSLTETSADELWEGAIFLPVKENAEAKVFYARLGGETQTFPFDQSQDFLEISGKHESFRFLKESNFKAKEWKIRDNATHSRSKTFKRAQD